MTDYTLALSQPEIARYRMMAARARVEEADAWRTAGIVPGARVADVGCGPGASLVVMADVVAPEGSVTGVDADETAVAAARDMIAQSGVVNATVRLGTADATGLQPGSFDVVVMRHVLAHNGGREAALVRHLAELTRPGGCVYLVDVELTCGRILGAEPSIEEMMARYVAFHQRRGNDPQIGLRLSQLLAAAGLEVIQHTGSYNIVQAPVGMRPPPWSAREAMVADGVASVEDVAEWKAALERLDAATERPVLFIPTFTAIGRRSA